MINQKKKQEYILTRNYCEFGDYLQKMRTKAKLTQREVSIALGYSSAQYISNFERGIAIPPLKKLKILVKLYKMPVPTVMKYVLDAERSIMNSTLNEKTA